MLVDMDPAPDTPEGDELEILAILVEKYEAEHFPMTAPAPIDAIKCRIEQAGLSVPDMQPYIGNSNRPALARHPTAEYGSGWSEKQLRHCMRAAEVFPDEAILSALRRELSWAGRNKGMAAGRVRTFSTLKPAL